MDFLAAVSFSSVFFFKNSHGFHFRWQLWQMVVAYNLDHPNVGRKKSHKHIRCITSAFAKPDPHQTFNMDSYPPKNLIFKEEHYLFQGSNRIFGRFSRQISSAYTSKTNRCLLKYGGWGSKKKPLGSGILFWGRAVYRNQINEWYPRSMTHRLALAIYLHQKN